MKIKTKTYVKLRGGKSRWYNGRLNGLTLAKIDAVEAWTYKIDAYAPSRGMFGDQKIWGAV